MPPYDEGRTGNTNSRNAAEAHHPLPPGWTPGLVFGRAGRPTMRSEIPAPRPFGNPLRGPLNARETCSTAAAGRVWASVHATLDVTRFPAPTAWGRGLRPHLSPPRLGASTATATGCALPAVSRWLARRRADPVGRVRLTGLRLTT